MQVDTATLTVSPAALRRAGVGDLLSDARLGSARTRELDATAVILPGTGGLNEYVAALRQREADFAAWDGRLAVLPDQPEAAHRVLVVDRYGQVYAAFDGEADALPDASALEEWFRFLATACPECGVLDDPIGRGWTP